MFANQQYLDQFVAHARTLGFDGMSSTTHSIAVFKGTNEFEGGYLCYRMHCDNAAAAYKFNDQIDMHWNLVDGYYSCRIIKLSDFLMLTIQDVDKMDKMLTQFPVDMANIDNNDKVVARKQKDKLKRELTKQMKQINGFN